MKVEHFALNVADPRAVAAWYREHLGMTIVRAGEAPSYTHFIADDAGLQIELYNDPRNPHFDGAATGTQTWHLAFLADDVEATLARLIAAGARPEGPVTTNPVGDQLGFVRDPWGFTLQFVKRAPR